MRMLTIVLFVSVAAWGQRNGIDGPTPGYVFDSAAREVRPMRGMAGSAHLGAAVIAEAEAASVSLDGSLAAASRLGAIEVVRNFDSTAPVRVELSREPGAVRFAWAGHDLAVVFTETRRAFIWRGLDMKADDVTAVDISTLDGEIATLAFDGERLVIAANGGLYLANKEGTRKLIALDDPSALLLAGPALFAADRGRGQVLLVRDYAGEATAEVFADVAEPVGLQLTKRGLLVASAGARSVDTFDILSKARTATVALDFLPTRLEALGAGSLALLNEGSASEPLFVFDSKDSLQVYFVPAGREQ